MNKDLAYYQRQFSSLRPDRSSGHAKPHKVCLLLAVMDLVEEGVIADNRIYFDELLKKQFTRYFNQYRHGNDINEPSQPYFYLESSEFWHHKPNPDSQEEYQSRIANRKHGGPGVVTRIIEYAYMDDELFHYMKSTVARTVLTAALHENLEDLGKRFERWALDIGKSEKTVKNYKGAINGSISTWAKDAGLLDRNFLEINNYKDYYELAQQAKKLEVFEVRDSKGKGMYSAALKLYGDFLADTTHYEVAEDIEAINQDPKLETTEKAVLVSTRIGQGQFRQSLISYWGGCALTGFRDPRFLIASHIKPWRYAEDKERLDPFNGLLLLPNLDKAFDLGYISFEESGHIRISKQLEESEVLGVSERHKLKARLTERHGTYLEYHRQRVFLK